MAGSALFGLALLVAVRELVAAAGRPSAKQLAPRVRRCTARPRGSRRLSRRARRDRRARDERRRIVLLLVAAALGVGGRGSAAAARGRRLLRPAAGLPERAHGLQADHDLGPSATEPTAGASPARRRRDRRGPARPAAVPRRRLRHGHRRRVRAQLRARVRPLRRDHRSHARQPRMAQPRGGLRPVLERPTPACRTDRHFYAFKTAGWEFLSLNSERARRRAPRRCAGRGGRCASPGHAASRSGTARS